MSKLLAHIGQVIQLDIEEQKTIENAFIPSVLRKGDYWITEDKVCRRVAFLEKIQC